MALPQTVLSSNLYGDSIFVVRDAEGEQGALSVEQVFVKVGRRATEFVEILDGVAPGDRVVTAGQNRLSSGAPVTIDESPSPFTAPAGG